MITMFIAPLVEVAMPLFMQRSVPLMITSWLKEDNARIEKTAVKKIVVFILWSFRIILWEQGSAQILYDRFLRIEFQIVWIYPHRMDGK